MSATFDDQLVRELAGTSGCIWRTERLDVEVLHSCKGNRRFAAVSWS